MEETVKILVVDDDEVDRMAVRRALKAAGVQMELSETDGCAGAITALQQQQFDCVLLDYLLPDGDGLSLIQQVRSLGITVPLVVLTGQGDEQVAVELMKAGACDYLSKARVSPDNLSQILRHCVRLYRAEKEVELANQRLQESEERYRLVLEGSNDGIWDWYCATDEVYCNDRLLEIIGVSRSEFSLTPAAFSELMHPEDLPKIKAAIAAHLNHGEKCEVEFRMRHVASGEYRYCIARGKAQRDRFGCPLRMSGILSDITERKRLEEALRKSESRFRRLAESNIIGVILVNLSGSILEANDAFLQMVGYTQQELRTGKLQWQKMTPPEYISTDQQAVEQLRGTGVLNSYEKEYIRKDGSRVPVLLGAALVEQMAEIAICFVLDLSERKQSEIEIVKLNRDLERRVSELETLLDVIPIGIAIAQDPECRYIRVNSALAKLINLSPDVNASKSAPPSEKPTTYQVYRSGIEVAAEDLPMQAAAKGIEVLDVELDLVTQNGATITKLLGNAAPLFDEQGNCRGSIGAFLDITERKRIEEQERFLAEASAILGVSLDYQTILENLARLVVPQLADWCSIHMVEEDDSVRQVTVAHVNPSKVKWAQEFQRRYPTNPNDTFNAPQVIRTGQSELYNQVPDRLLQSIAQDAEHLELLRQVGIKSVLCVPMKARGRTLGAISFVSAESNRSYTQADLALAEDLGRRAGLAVDNARLYEQANEIGENLRQAIIILGEQQQQLRVLQRITNLLNQRLTNLPALLQVMVEAVCDGIPEAQFAVIVLHDPQTDRLELTATSGIDTENLLLTEFFNAEAGLLNRVFLTGESQLFQGARGEGRGTRNSVVSLSPYHPITPSSTSPASIYAVVIASAQAGSLGVLAIGNWDTADAFDVEDQNLLAAVGEQAAIAINNARLINALEEREERLAIQNKTLAQQNRQLELSRQKIEQQNLQLVEAARLKSQFLATMSHELRTPMNAVIGFAQVLLRQRTARLCASQVDMVERILNNGKNLLALINDILDLSKIEAGRLELKLEEVNFTQLVVATISELRPLAEQKQLLLKVDAELDDPKVINDSTRLRQVLVNLISNAIKFTETGSVEVRVSELSSNRVLLSVKDTGIGIAEAELEHIFEEFRQVDQTTTRKHGGTGLGLAITKSLVNMMQGIITVESKLGQGSTFCVQLPRQVRSEE
ncbi:PAS domain S-box protein [Chroococcidiopsis sp. CCMEE 29]|uniref:PAS domain S-box protein n=1 Tax=Chroococcidiopsis sp. CCMEE 29 TaxID=155894 RepID=UPI0020208789|nr:PAS domain S-box protein [Chroococcidiopsis sp. CCMEE 29]